MACLPNAWYLETGLLGDDSPLSLETAPWHSRWTRVCSGSNVAPTGMIDDTGSGEMVGPQHGFYGGGEQLLHVCFS
jgi:hypothetical protein